nr:molybdopterin-dependent oxidoreductase [Mesorhizobium sp. WSM4875]
MSSKTVSTSYHWGSYDIELVNGRVRSLNPAPDDPAPSPIGRSILSTIDDPARITQPMIRAGYLARLIGKPGASGGEGRGQEPFVRVSWDQALSIVADELARVKVTYGNEAIFAGSYGWASAGRFHHAQSQMRRFLNLYGGFVFHKDTYSLAAARVLLPHIIGNLDELFAQHTPWSTIAEQGELVVAFGGLPMKNTQVNPGGVGRHLAAEGMRACRSKGVSFINVGPNREDVPEWLDAEWLALRPHTDTALMLGIAHTLASERLHNEEFLSRYCVGYDRFESYLFGVADGLVKDADWAAEICGLRSESIRALARQMAGSRTLISVSFSLQRADHGEQPFWMATTLASMLGQIGLPGGGIGYGYNAVHAVGASASAIGWASVPQGENRVKQFIPVARIADMLLNPGKVINYNGNSVKYPDIRLIYWVGGNPYHHHQDLNKLNRAWSVPETIIVHEPWWTATARRADIVLPATTPIERNDLGAAKTDNSVVAMKQAVEPLGAARNDFDIFVDLADRLGFAEAFTEGRGEMEWLRHLYEVSRQEASTAGIADLPDFDNFWKQGRVQLSEPATARVMLADFRDDPDKHALSTPSGRIEIFSARIASFEYKDCPGHAVWLEPREWLGASLTEHFPLHLISNQPATRLHSQLDNGVFSRESKIRGREPIYINALDARDRRIASHDIVRVFNERGACLAGAIVTDSLARGVAILSTGAWYDPINPREGALDAHGNPNVLTRDEGCSSLSQGPSAQSVLVQIERYSAPLPRINAFDPPAIIQLADK